MTDDTRAVQRQLDRENIIRGGVYNIFGEVRVPSHALMSDATFYLRCPHAAVSWPSHRYTYVSVLNCQFIYAGPNDEAGVPHPTREK